MSYAKAMASDPRVSATLPRLRKWALPSHSELQKLEAFHGEWIDCNGFQNHGLNAYFGANMVFHRVAWGQIGGLDDPRAMAFLKKDEPRNTGSPVTSYAVRARRDEMIWMANYVIERCVSGRFTLTNGVAAAFLAAIAPGKSTSTGFTESSTAPNMATKIGPWRSWNRDCFPG